ncbi:gliding motility-associated C-terminal domain-containing protein [Flavobacterium sp.]|uniref:T9SS type B sorting domain-containing protein n=1 Tax=Flavobacterium sp. TaxID=239 RepID=UPI0025C37EE2|nr:gliding motility-associated C-terminal domain-containing protein [Flavobacterium sp.]
MNIRLKLLFLLLCFQATWSQQSITLYNQFNGRYDFTFVGNTLNENENSFQLSPTILTSSSANLNLGTGDNIEAAYLYWAGCGTGDFNIQLNGTPINATRTFSNILVQGTDYNFFSAFADVTSLVQSQGNGTYTVSDLDVSSFINYHFENRTNFAGWAMVIIYKNNALPLNQLNVYDGLQVVSIAQNFLDVSLNALNVIDNADAKIGFVAWEGDSGLEVNETLRINGNIISNPPLNPATNAFNSTNSITNSNQLYNMDLDVYNIQNNINIGDTSALIQLTSGQDYVMINAIVTKLNSQLPDATIEIEEIVPVACNSREITINYEAFNVNATANLNPNTPITFYANGIAIGTTFTQNTIPIGGSETGSITLTIPPSIPLSFTLTVVIDDTGNGTGVVTEIIENNNNFSLEVNLLTAPVYNQPENQTSCNLGFTSGIFDFSSYENEIKTNPLHVVTFHETQQDAQNNTNSIVNTNHYEATTTPKTIWVRIENENGCYSITSFLLLTKNCPPIIYNAVSPNNDGLNDLFFIKGLRNIFLNFHLEVYNRWGRLLWTGNNNTPDWNGKAENSIDGERVPSGTYYYILHLNDPDYPDALTGYLQVKWE